MRASYQDSQLLMNTCARSETLILISSVSSKLRKVSLFQIWRTLCSLVKPMPSDCLKELKKIWWRKPRAITLLMQPRETLMGTSYWSLQIKSLSSMRTTKMRWKRPRILRIWLLISVGAGTLMRVFYNTIQQPWELGTQQIWQSSKSRTIKL